MIIVREKYCPKNQACQVVAVCPVNAITQKYTLNAPEVDNEKCISCQKCSRSCGVFLFVSCSARTNE